MNLNTCVRHTPAVLVSAMYSLTFVSRRIQGVSSTSAYARQLSRSSGSLSCSGNFLAAAAASTPGGLMGGEDMQTWIVQVRCVCVVLRLVCQNSYGGCHKLCAGT